MGQSRGLRTVLFSLWSAFVAGPLWVGHSCPTPLQLFLLQQAKKIKVNRGGQSLP